MKAVRLEYDAYILHVGDANIPSKVHLGRVQRPNLSGAA
jgi:hypothetical protein